MLIWYEIMWNSLKHTLTGVCLDLINSCRHNQIGDLKLIGDIINSFVAIEFPQDMVLWIDGRQITIPKENIYQNYFEKQLLQATEKFYQTQAAFDFEHGSILEYLKKITPFISNDVHYIYSHLPSSTQQQMKELINIMFSKDHLNVIYNQMDKSIDGENQQDLKIIYQSIKHISTIKNRMAEKIENYFFKTGVNAIKHVSEIVINNPMIYAETILNVHQKFLQLVQEAFNGEQDFTTAVEKACARFIHKNDVTKATGSTTKSPELLGQYYYMLLRKGNESVEETILEEKFKQITIILNYVEDKDFVRIFYQEMFPERSASQLNTTDDYNSSQIATSETKIDSQLEEILRFYTNRWKDYKISTKVSCDKDDMYKIVPMTIEIWHKVLFQPLNKQITRACLDLIKSKRNNKVINTRLISEVIQSYIALAFSEDTTNNNKQMTLTIYKEYFETPFIQDTEQFYRLEAATFLVQNSLTEYLKKVAKRLDEEGSRVQSYLHSSTLPLLVKKVEEVLIRDQLERIYIEAKALISDERFHDLALLFKLVNRVLNANVRLKIIVENHIYEMGMNDIERVSGTAINDPKVYIEAVIEVHQKFFKPAQEIFSDEQVFIVALNKACGKFINNNAVTQTANTTKKSPELLARYCDMMLRKGNKADDGTDLEEKLNQIMVVFNYIEDKDVYQKLYGKMLAKRLVGQLSASDDHEQLMISKLKQACGYEYTAKLERMFQDVGVSKDLNDAYRTICEEKGLSNIIDFSVMVCTSNSWPFSTSENILLPIELKRTFDSFTDFYTHQHNGRKLTWVHQYSKGVLQTSFTSQKYTLQVSTYQMIVLLLFNKSLNWTVERMQDETQMKSELLVQVLCGLLKSKLLICTEVNEDLEENDIQMKHSIQLSNHFKSDKIRVNLNVPLKSIEQKDKKNLDRTIDEDRQMIIQTAIVRIMKDRRTLKYNLLMNEIIQRLNKYFQPSVPLVKKCIDILIEQEYLERDPTNKDALRYLA